MTSPVVLRHVLLSSMLRSDYFAHFSHELCVGDELIVVVDGVGSAREWLMRSCEPSIHGRAGEAERRPERKALSYLRVIQVKGYLLLDSLLCLLRRIVLLGLRQTLSLTLATLEV